MLLFVPHLVCHVWTVLSLFIKKEKQIHGEEWQGMVRSRIGSGGVVRYGGRSGGKTWSDAHGGRVRRRFRQWKGEALEVFGHARNAGHR
jgi:hypothetical protein